MSRVSTIFTNFIVGEVSPRQEGNVDLQFYQQSCRILENFIISSHGGVERDPGTKYICDAKNTSEEGHSPRLIPFKNGTTQYVLEFSDSYMRVINGLAQVEVSAAPYTVDTTYNYSQLMNIRYAQVAENLMYLVVPGDRPQKVTCTSSASWTISNLAFTGITFSAANSYPGAICVFEQKLILAGSNTNPNRIWFSKPGAFTNFQSSSGSFTVDVYTPERMQIKWLVAAKDVIVFGSDTAIGTITGGGAALSSSNFQIRIETAIGTNRPQGLRVGDTVIYPPVGSRTLREFAYNEDGVSWYTKDLTMFAEHLSPLEGFKDMALQVSPDIVLWVAAGAGGLCGLTYDRVAQIQGWHRHTFENGVVEAVCVTRSHSSIAEDIVYLCVHREQGRTIEYMAPRDFGDDQTDAYFVHCGATVDLGNKNIEITDVSISSTSTSSCVVTLGSAFTFINNDLIRITGVVGVLDSNGHSPLNDKVFTCNDVTSTTVALLDVTGSTEISTLGCTAYDSGGYVTQVAKAFNDSSFWHLMGTTDDPEVLSVLVDGAAHPDVELTSSGIITLQVYANKFHVGYGYTSILKPQRIEAGADDGTAQGAVKRVHKVIVRVFKSLGCKIGPDMDNLDTIVFRTASDVMGAPPPLYSGDKEISFPGGYETEGNIVIVQDQPLPLAIIALVAKLATYE